MKILKILLLFLLTSQISYAEDKIVRIATLYDYAPFCMRNRDYKIHRQLIPVGEDAVGFEGFAWDIVRESYHLMGYTIDLSVYPWERARYAVENGYCDVLFPTGMNKKRLKIYNYSKESVLRTNYLLYVRKDFKLEYIDLESFRGKEIAVIRGFNYGDKWAEADYIEKYNITTIKQGFKMLDTGRIDAFAGYDKTWDYYLKEHSIADKYKKLPYFDSGFEYLVTYRNKNNIIFLDVFDEGYQRLKRSGKADEIINKWFGTEPVF